MLLNECCEESRISIIDFDADVLRCDRSGVSLSAR